MNIVGKIGFCTLFMVMLLTVAPDLPAKGFFKGEEKMKSTEDIAKDILTISEDRYFNDTESLFLDMELKLADIEFKGVAIQAPSRISLDKQTQLPMIMAIQQTGLRAWEYPRDMNCVLTATNMATRISYFGQVFRDPKAETFSMPVEASQPPKPEGVDAISLSSGLSRIDARAILDLPNQSGKYRLTVLMYDWVSNTIEVDLEGAPGFPPAQMPAVSPMPAAPGKGLRIPSFLPTKAVPDPVGKNDPAADLTLSPNPEPGVKLTAQGALSVVADAFHIPPSPMAITEVNGEQKEVCAVVPATVAILGKSWAMPLRFDWVIPVYADKLPKPGDRVEGHFSIDVLADSPMTLTPGDYSVILVVEGQVLGPYPLAMP